MRLISLILIFLTCSVSAFCTAQADIVSDFYIKKSPVIHSDNGEIVLKTGTIKKGEAIATSVFSFNHPLRLKEPIIGNFVGIEVMPKGANGFLVGSPYNNNKLYCYFKNNTYSTPSCFANYNNGFGEFVLSARTSSLIPIEYMIETRYNIPSGSHYKIPVHEAEVPIFDHEFKINLRFVKWQNKKVIFDWYADDSYDSRIQLPIDPDGNVYFDVPQGKIKLSRIDGDNNSALVELISQ